MQQNQRTTSQSVLISSREKRINLISQAGKADMMGLLLLTETVDKE